MDRNEAIDTIINNWPNGRYQLAEALETLIPELRESEDELMRKEAIAIIKQYNIICEREGTKCYTADRVISWLEKQGKKSNIPQSAEDNLRRQHIIQVLEYARSLDAYNQFGKERINKDIAWLEKQGNHKPLYIRFGYIPANEKSKIYHGEEEIGEEDGVSVYPAFESNGNIVIGLTLPITKTTLYTQQHLLEYDNRPCYLVSGDYVGKGADGEPLIRNVSVIKQLDNYRIKEPTDKPEPKFEIEKGKWYVCAQTYTLRGKIVAIKGQTYQSQEDNTISGEDARLFIDKHDGKASDYFHPWTIQDAQNGDVIFSNDGHGNDSIELIKSITSKKIEFWFCLTNSSYDVFDGICPYTNMTSRQNATPATKEQCDLLFKKIKESGYEWNATKKELNKIEQKPTEWTKQQVVNALTKWLTEQIAPLRKKSLDGTITERYEMFEAALLEMRSFVNSSDFQLGKDVPKDWSEEDEEMYNQICNDIDYLSRFTDRCDINLFNQKINWLESLKGKLKGE